MKERERNREGEGEGKKSRRRMDYRGASKDGTYGSKNRNQSHWLKAAWPEKRESTWTRWLLSYLDRPWVPVCLYLLISTSLSFYLSRSFLLSPSSTFSSIRFFVFFFLLHVANLPSARIFSRGGSCALATFILGPCTPIRVESFHANSSENAFYVERRCRTRFPVKTVTRRLTGRKQHRRPRISSPLWSLRLGERTPSKRKTRSILSA